MGETAVAAVIAWSNTMPCLIYALAFWSGSKYIAQGEMTVAEVTTTAVTVIIGEFAIARIAPSVQSLASGLAVVGTVMQSLARESPVDPLSTDGLTPEVTIGEVVFDNVGLVYPSRDHVRVLDNLTFTCPAMKTTAIVGASGCGKSSIVGLLERFYEPTKGQVRKYIAQAASSLHQLNRRNRAGRSRCAVVECSMVAATNFRCFARPHSLQRINCREYSEWLPRRL